MPSPAAPPPAAPPPAGQPGAETTAAIPLTPRALAAVVILLGVLAVGWVPDYRYAREAQFGYWKPRAEQLLTACEHSTSGEITTSTWQPTITTITIPCSRVRR